MKPDPGRLPTHVSFIMDGNGRWAKERGKERVYGHFEGVESVRAVMEASVEWGIPYVSFFAFSEENWGRPEAEVQTLMELMGRAMYNELHNFMEQDIRFIRWDILQAAEKMAHDLIEHPGHAAAPEDLERHLVTAGIPEPDLLVRTSGEKRISNYLLWQTAYTEFVFTDTLWPDFRKEAYREALEEYAARDRRFGKIK